MTWVRIDCDIASDPAIGRIAAAARLSLNDALGAVLRVYCKLPKHARTGDLAAITDAHLEDWVGYRGEPGAFAGAFRANLCDDRGVVRSWEKYNGAALREQDADRERKAEERRRQAEERARRAGVVGSDPQAPEPRAHKSPRKGTPTRPGPSDGVSGGPSDRHPALTERDVTPIPSGPDGPDSLPAVPAVDPVVDPFVAEAQAARAARTGELFAAQEAALFAAARPHEAAALEHLIGAAAFAPALVGELYAIATGVHHVRSSFPPYSLATIEHVMQAVAEWVIERRPWNQSLFRGFVRKVLERPPEPRSAEERDAAQAAALRMAVPALEVPAYQSDDEREAARRRREDAMQHFRAEFRRNNPPPRSARLYESVATEAPAVAPDLALS